MLSTQIFGGKDLNLGKGEMNFAFIRRFPNLDNALFWIFCTFDEKVKAISVKLEMKRASSIDPTRHTQGIPVFTTYLREREHSTLS